MDRSKALKSLFALLLALPVLGLFFGGLFWDVFINPSPPAQAAVTAESFRFEDFGTHPDSQLALQRALHRLFPEGTKRADVETVLVGRAGARVRGHGHETVYSHAAPAFFPLLCRPTWNVFADYDAGMTLESISVQRLCYAAREQDAPLGSKAWTGKGSF